MGRDYHQEGGLGSWEETITKSLGTRLHHLVLLSLSVLGERVPHGGGPGSWEETITKSLCWEKGYPMQLCHSSLCKYGGRLLVTIIMTIVKMMISAWSKTFNDIWLCLHNTRWCPCIRCIHHNTGCKINVCTLRPQNDCF